jgi:hypothetical protein
MPKTSTDSSLQSTINCFPKRNLARSLRLWLAGLFGILIAYTVTVHCLIIMDPRPIEYREGAQLHLVNELQHNINIYDFGNQPYDVNVYGIAYHKLAAMVTPAWVNSYQPQRILTAVFIIAGCAVILLMFRKKRPGALIGVVAACVWYAHNLRLWGICGRPDVMAAFFYFCTAFLPWRYRFSRPAIAVSAVCSVLAFFTKPYFAAGMVFVFIYLVYRRRLLDAALYAAFFSVLFAASAALAHLAGDAYFYNTIFVNLGYGGGWHWKWVFGQIVRFAGLNLPLVACVAVAAYFGIRRSKATGGATPEENQDTGSTLDLRYLVMAGCCAILVLLKIAQNKGSHEYFIHLLSPILLVGAYKFLAIRGHITLALVAGVIQASILAPPFPNFHEKEWNVVKATIAGERSVMHSPTTVHLALARNETVFNSGQTEFFRAGLKKGAGIYPQAGTAWNGFQTDLRKRIEQCEFSLVLLNAKMPSIIDRSVLAEHYRLSGTLPAPLHRHRNNVLELWHPINNP